MHGTSGWVAGLALSVAIAGTGYQAAYASRAYRYSGGAGSTAVTASAESSRGASELDFAGDAYEPSLRVSSADDRDVTTVAPAAAPPTYADARDTMRREDGAPLAASGTTSPAEQASGSETATDAVDTSGTLLVYTGLFHLAVYEVHESQERIVAATRALGGFVSTQADDRLVVRVPAPRFHAMVAQVEQAGDVEHREVQAQDVSEEFHDLEIRIRNLEAMRQRIEALLAQAQTVEDALRVEQELQRLTAELEHLRGRQRFLADRISYSTLTVLFRPRPREQIGQPEIVQLPFSWLDQLGLSTLLDLR